MYTVNLYFENEHKRTLEQVTEEELELLKTTENFINFENGNYGFSINFSRVTFWEYIAEG
jgi:hypothetical protein